MYVQNNYKAGWNVDIHGVIGPCMLLTFADFRLSSNCKLLLVLLFLIVFYDGLDVLGRLVKSMGGIK